MSAPRKPVRDDDDRKPRGHAYIHMRNRGYTVLVDYRERDNPQAQRMMEAVLKILRDEPAGAGGETKNERA